MLRFLALNTGARRDFVPFRQPPPPHPLFSLRSQTATSQLAGFRNTYLYIYTHTHIYIYIPTLIITNLSLWTRLKLACVYPLPAHAMHTAPWACSCRLLDTLAYGIRMEVLTLSAHQRIKILQSRMCWSTIVHPGLRYLSQTILAGDFPEFPHLHRLEC